MAEAMSSEKSKEVTIIVNGRSKTLSSKEELTFDEIVDFGFDDPQRGPMIVFTITYRKGDDKKPEGSVVEGGSVKVKDGMIFNVTRTDKS